MVDKEAGLVQSFQEKENDNMLSGNAMLVDNMPSDNMSSDKMLCDKIVIFKEKILYLIPRCLTLYYYSTCRMS
jgi:hypothetical protein